MKTIVVDREGESWIAYPAEQPELKVRGTSETEAVGRLVVGKARKLGLMIQRRGDVPENPASENGKEKGTPKKGRG